MIQIIYDSLDEICDLKRHSLMSQWNCPLNVYQAYHGQQHAHMTLELPQKAHTSYSDLKDFFSYTIFMIEIYSSNFLNQVFYTLKM